MQFEATVLNEGQVLCPLDENSTLSDYAAGHILTISSEPSLKGIIEAIDNRADFKSYMQNYAYAHGGTARGPRRDGPREDGYVCH